jgi:hypothetical protein
VPSLGIVEETLQREDESYRDKANSLDTKSGVILSAAGVIVALVGTSPSVAGLVAQIAAIASGVAAVLSLLPRPDKTIGPRKLRDRYLQQDEITTRLFILNTRIPLHERNESRLVLKAKRLKTAACLLLGSAGTIAVGGIVDQIRH